MNIFLNEIPLQIEPGLSLFALRERVKAAADIMIVNGCPAHQDMELREGDHVTLIMRGEQPTASELQSLMMARHTPGVHNRVKNSCVGIAGAGGLGSHVAIALARVGVGQLNIADFDVVEPSNLNRQQYFIDQIGIPKVTALRENLKRINPYTRVVTFNEKVTPQNITKLFGSVDILVEAFDAADQKAMLVQHFLQQCPHKPIVAASGMAGYGPSNSIRTRRVSRHFFLCGDGVTAAGPGYGLMAPRVGIAAHHQANTVLRLLLNEQPESGYDDETDD